MESKCKIIYGRRINTYKERLTVEIARFRFLEQKVSISDLAQEIGVHEDTIRRHLMKLGIYQIRLKKEFLEQELKNKSQKNLAQDLWLRPTKLKRILMGQDLFRAKIKRHIGDSFITEDGYRMIVLKGFYIPEHVLIWKNAHGPPKGVIHHHNGDKLDNRLSNLEDLSNANHLALHREMHYKLANRMHRRKESNSTINISMAMDWLANELIMPEADFVGVTQKPVCLAILPD